MIISTQLKQKNYLNFPHAPVFSEYFSFHAVDEVILGTTSCASGVN
jgi:hypothetical protein